MQVFKMESYSMPLQKKNMTVPASIHIVLNHKNHPWLLSIGNIIQWHFNTLHILICWEMEEFFENCQFFSGAQQTLNSVIMDCLT